MPAGRLHALLNESLGLWQVDGRVAPGTGPLLATITGAGGLCLSIVRADDDEDPVRWWLRWHRAGVDGEILRRKPCASTLGLLRTLREALGAQAGPRVRIAAGAGSEMTQ